MSEIDLYQRRNDFFLTPSQNVKGGVVAGLLLGVVALVAGVFMAEPSRIWSAILLNTFFLFSIALGASAFGAMQDVVGAVWGRPIKRILEAISSFVPVASGILLFFLICILLDVLHARDVYVWMKDPHMLDHFPGKNVWLTPKFMAIRDIVALVIIITLVLWQLRLNVSRDRLLLNGDRAQAETASIMTKVKLRHWSAPVLILYALSYSLLAFDLIMSLSPTWFSTLWAGWMFAIMMQTLMATIMIFLFALRGTTVGQIYQRQQFHDIGKLMHGFTIFFAYTTYAHVLTYWYGNVPEETEFYIERLQGPWLWIILIVPFFVFVIPLYSLLFKAAKWTAPVAVTLASMILVSQWFIYNLVITPATAGHHWTFAWLDAGMLAAILGLFLATFLAFGKRVPMLGINDALLAEALDGGHH